MIPTTNGLGGASVGAGLGAPTGVAPIEGAQRAATAMRERVFQSLESTARALRKYACDATAMWETVLVNVKPRQKATFSGLLPRSDNLPNWVSGRALQRSTLMEGNVDIPRDQIGCIRSAAMFHAMPVATNVKTVIYRGLRVIIIGCGTGSKRFCKSL
eukprot:1983533-Pleurochrysis_carterae.AAC.1